MTESAVTTKAKRGKGKKASEPEVSEARIRTRVLPVEDLVPADYNPRKITPHAAEGLQASIREFGYVEPIIWNERTGLVVGGHQRRDALIAGGATHIEVVVVDLDPSKEQALNVTLNNPAIQGTWDDEKLQEILSGLKVDMDDGAFAASFFEDVHLDELAATFDAPGSDLGFGAEGGTGRGGSSPTEFPPVDDATIKTDYRCPKCAYEWAGKAK